MKLQHYNTIIHAPSQRGRLLCCKGSHLSGSMRLNLHEPTAALLMLTWFNKLLFLHYTYITHFTVCDQHSCNSDAVYFDTLGLVRDGYVHNDHIAASRLWSTSYNWLSSAASEVQMKLIQSCQYSCVQQCGRRLHVWQIRSALNIIKKLLQPMCQKMGCHFMFGLSQLGPLCSPAVFTWAVIMHCCIPLCRPPAHF